jgi:hypothetical protein
MDAIKGAQTMPTQTSIASQERLSARIPRYQARDKPHSIDVNGVVAEVQVLERECDGLRAELAALRRASGSVTWLHCNSCYAVGAQTPNGTRWTQSLTKCDHTDCLELTGPLVWDVLQRIEQGARIHAAEAMVKMHSDMRQNLMSKFFNLASRAEAQSCQA